MATTTPSLIARIKTFVRNPIFQCLLLATLLFALDFAAPYLPVITDDLQIIAKMTGARKWIQPDNAQTRERVARDFLLIDVANDDSAYCDESVIGSELLVDSSRPVYPPCYNGVHLERLTKLFKWLSDNDSVYQQVVCNISFDQLDTSAVTALLLTSLQKIADRKKLICAAIYDTASHDFYQSDFSRLIPRACKGATNEELTGDIAFSYRLSYQPDSVPTLPLLMLEKINGYAKAKKTSFGGWNKYYKGKDAYYGSNTFVPEMLLVNKDIDSLPALRQENGYIIANSTVCKMDLWQALLWCNNTDQYYLREILASPDCHKRTIFIGNFDHATPGVHPTLYGDLDGSTILLNVYYNLVNQENKFSWWYCIVTFCLLYLVAVFTLFPATGEYNGRYILLNMGVNHILDNLHYWLLFVVTILVSFAFDRTSNVLISLVALVFIDKLLKAYRKARERKNTPPIPYYMQTTYIPANSIDEIISRLQQLITHSISTDNRLGYFAALYHKVTVRVKEGIDKQEFEDGARMEKLDVIFANRFLAAVHAWQLGQPTSACWVAAFTASKKRSPLVLQHLLLGMNAHINYDLGIAAVETAGTQPIDTIRADFNSINTILGSLIFEVLTEINRVSPLLSLFGLHAANPSILIQFSITNARDGAWSFAEDLHSKGLGTTACNQCMTTRDASIEKLGLALVKPKGLLRITRWVIHLFEWKKPSKVIEAFYGYKKQYINSTNAT